MDQTYFLKIFTVSAETIKFIRLYKKNRKILVRKRKPVGFLHFGYFFIQQHLKFVSFISKNWLRKKIKYIQFFYTNRFFSDPTKSHKIQNRKQHKIGFFFLSIFFLSKTFSPPIAIFVRNLIFLYLIGSILFYLISFKILLYFGLNI